MAIERRWAAVPPRAFTAAGTARGVVTLSSTAGFKVKMQVTISHPTLPSLVLEVKRVTDRNHMTLGPKGKITDFEDISAYDTTSFVFAQEQDRPAIPANEIHRSTFEEEPTIAQRTISVDRYGNPYSHSNPMPVEIVYTHTDNPLSWNIDGNTGIQESDFLGTVDASDLIIKTNLVERMRIKSDGKIGIGEANPQSIIHIRGHANYPGTGRLINTFSVQTSDTNFNQAWTFQVANQTSALITIRVTARQSDGGNRASFIRTFTVFREGSLAQVMGPIQSDYTAMSVSGYQIKVSLQGDTVIFNVKSALADETKWFGSIDVDLTK